MDPDGKAYLEIGLSGTYGPFSGGAGFRIDTKGIDFFHSAGGGGGAMIQLFEFSSGHLDHERKLTVSRNVTLAGGAGLKGSYEGEFDPNNSLSVGQDPKMTYSVVAGLGGGAYQEYVHTIPLIRFPNFWGTPGGNTNDNIPKVQMTTGGQTSPQTYKGATGSSGSSNNLQSIQTQINGIRAQLQSIQSAINNLKN